MEVASILDKNLEDAIRERRAYQRKWRFENRDRIRRYNAEYWERRARRNNQEVRDNAANENYSGNSVARPGG